MNREYWFEASAHAHLRQQIEAKDRHWLVTGAAGFIGSNIVEALLHLGQRVTGFDNFATGYQHNLDHVASKVGDNYSNFTLIEGDIRDRDACAMAVRNADIVLHQAALGSVPRSIDDPQTSHDVNVTGFLNMLDAARLKACDAFVYAASSSTYGDEPNLPKVEERIGNPLSPYAATKLFDEIYAGIYARSYGFGSTGLRYFNVFGPRQDPDGAYAAVIPKWTERMIQGDEVLINGDGLTSRDFCFVDNAVQANLRAAMNQQESKASVYNVAVGDRTSLLDLFAAIRDELHTHQVHYALEPVHGPERAGDVRHSLASIEKAAAELGYAPSHRLREGLTVSMNWYVQEREALLQQ